MSERRELLMLFFDIPVKTRKQRKAYREFMKYIRGEGYARLQNSVYLKTVGNMSVLDGECARMRGYAPSGSDIQLLPMTCAAFERIRKISGDGFDLGSLTDSLIVI